MDSPSTTDLKSDQVSTHAHASKLRDVESETKADLGIQSD